ncbi:MAG: hypothetical protein A2V88_06940 [Elusimicrobia bacterium RBG_16_66_12]|nr:MAG: hypothetical protein A2V88_06940 [Elusimicrobia bacterium RBG_16_66_12]
MLALVPVVNTFALPQANKRHESGAKDSVKSYQREVSKLVKALMATEGNSEYVDGHAQAVGLDRPMPYKGVGLLIGKDAHRSHVVYEPDADNGNRPVYVYLVITKRTQHDIEERYYRVALDGQLEKVITLRNKLDEQGKVLREGRSRTEEGITSPDIKKTFKAEMTYWLKDWLKKELKKPAKVTAASTSKP